MITIKTGKIFVNEYNRRNKTNLSPKEILLMMIDKAYRGGIHMDNWTNSWFFSYLLAYNKAIKKSTELPNFSRYVDEFCRNVEDNTYGIETSMQVFGGCGVPSKTSMPTTEFNYCDNLHFTIDERYCSFIGAFLRVNIGSKSTVINDKDVIWTIYEGFEKYYEFIHNNDGVKDKQIPTWNGLYLYEKITKRNGYVDNNFDAKKGFKPINFVEFLEILSFLDNKVNTLLFSTFEKTNKSGGYVTIDLDGVKGWFSIFKKVLKEIDEDFDIRTYVKLFGKEALIYKALEMGEVTSDMLDPLYEFKVGLQQDNIKFLTEYLKLIMTKDEKDMSYALANFIIDVSSNSTKSVKNEIEAIFSSHNNIKFMESIIAFCEKANSSMDKIKNIVSYFVDDANSGKLKEFLLYTKINCR